jgi:hypothetical protein
VSDVLRPPANVERLVADYLRSASYLASEPLASTGRTVGSRVSTHVPADPVFPLVVLSRISGARRDNDHLDQPRLQIEAWSEKGDRAEAHEVGQRIRALMASDQIAGLHNLGIVTGTEELSALYLADQLTARPRYLIDIRVYVHPNPGGAVASPQTVGAGISL